MYKQLHLYLHIKKQHAFLLRNDDFKFHLYFSNQIEFNLKSINQEFLLFLKSLYKHSIQYFTIEFSLFWLCVQTDRKLLYYYFNFNGLHWVCMAGDVKSGIVRPETGTKN